MLSLDFYKRDAKALNLYVRPDELTASLALGSVGVLNSGDGVVYLGTAEYPSGTRARFAAAPSAKLPNPATIAATDAERAEVLISLAEKVGPNGTQAVLLRAPLGAMTEGGKVLRAIDSAKNEAEAARRATRAQEALRLAYAWAKRPAPFPAPNRADLGMEPEKEVPKEGGKWKLPDLPSLGGVSVPLALVAAVVGLAAVAGYVVEHQSQYDGEIED